jgi:hypothetical protein
VLQRPSDVFAAERVGADLDVHAATLRAARTGQNVRFRRPRPMMHRQPKP